LSFDAPLAPGFIRSIIACKVLDGDNWQSMFSLSGLVRIRKLFPVFVVAAALLAYGNSLRGPFIFDDVPSIRENPTIQHLWPIGPVLSPPHAGAITVEGRPLINLSLAINYAISGYDVWSYHAFNLAVHILAGLTLLGVVRRTLPRAAGTWCSTSERPRSSAALPDSVAAELALAAAVLWTVHPLQTESVTYIIQRAESITGLLYLLTVYGFIRGTGSHRPRLWFGLSVVACALGMMCKEVMVSAPVMVLLYDRAFDSGSFRESWRRHWTLYLGLAATWVVLGLVLASGQLPATLGTMHRLGLSWWQYLLTEPGVILHYLRLSVWPRPLCFDYYGWPVARAWTSVLPPALIVGALLGASAWAWRRNAACGFLGAWFFLILAPSSSVIPLDSPAYEHRMYLPLAAVVVLAVLGIHAVAGRRSVAVFAMLAVGLGFLTWQRNQDYRSDLAIWQDTVLKRPNNPRARNYLGVALSNANRVPEAIEQYEQALRLKPDYAEAEYNLGNALLASGKIQEAASHWQRAVTLNPNYTDARNNLGAALAQAGRFHEAIEQFESVLRVAPNDAEVHFNLATALEQAGRIQEAIGQYEQALWLKPDYAAAESRLARLRATR
jgi:tetratricopeptide (TPR) repeat protein